MQNANLLLYINLSGEVFYIIAHRMRSQKVTEELQLRVYNDLAVAICHPTVIQNLIKGALQLLELNLTDVRTLMDRIVHSSIMTVNSFSMEKLFELTLIATRYQYTVVQHPKDILLIALNHLDSIRKSINDVVGIQLTTNLHATVIDRMNGLNSIKMQDYRYAILTYLGDVKLKMTNLIRLGLQKPTGEFVKEFPYNTIRPEFKEPGTIERNDGQEEESESDSESIGDDLDGLDLDDDADNVIADMQSQDEEDDDPCEDQGCHFEPDNKDKMTENDEVLEILLENEFSEFHESDKPHAKISHTIRFRKAAEDTKDTEEFKSSLELNGNRGITLGLSIYDIPGNSDEDVASGKQTSIFQKQRSRSIPCQSSGAKGTTLGNPKLNDFIDLKAVQGLDLCSILLGCKQGTENTDRDQRLYHSPAQFENDPDSTLENSRSGEESSDDKAYMSRDRKREKEMKGQVSGINIVRFDARTDRSASKAALARISKEFDIENCDDQSASDSSARSPFDLISEDDETK